MYSKGTLDYFFKNKKIKVDEKEIACITLSDDEEVPISETNITNRSDCSDSSLATEPYSLDSFSATPSTSSYFTSSRTSGQKYSSSIKKNSSPIKKRRLSLEESSSKAKRCKSHALMANRSRNVYQQNDKNTKFLLTIIYKFLKDDSVKLLLNEKSATLLVKSLDVKKPVMKIVCSLFWRHEIWHRLHDIKKIVKNKGTVDISIDEVLNFLVGNGFLNMGDSENELSFDDLVNLSNCCDLLYVCKTFKLKARNKEEAKHALINYCNQKKNITHFLLGVSNSDNKKRVLKELSTKVGKCYKLSDLAKNTLKQLYILMYLGMDYSIIRENKLELTLQNEKGNVESFPIDKDIQLDSASVVFKDRQKFEGHISKPDWLPWFTPPYFYIKILAEDIQYLKRDNIPDNLDLAVNILTTLSDQNSFRQHKKSEWYSEKALIVDNLLLSPDEAALVLIEAFQAVLSEEYREILKFRAQFLPNRKTNSIMASIIENNDIKEEGIREKFIHKVPMSSPGRGKKKFKTHTSEGVKVQHAESFCISYYIDEGKYTHGQHWEGRIVTTIFFILFWDIIYKPIRGLQGIFLCPLDMFTESFYTIRKTLIEEKLKEIENSSLESLLEKIESTWNNRPENKLSGIDRRISLHQVCCVVRLLGPRCSAALCRRLAMDYSGTHSGFPDLTMWNEHTGQITFVEVKTDTDKPSIKQIQWMHYLKQNDIDTEFCYVGVNTTRCKARNCKDRLNVD